MINCSRSLRNSNSILPVVGGSPMVVTKYATETKKAIASRHFPSNHARDVGVMRTGTSLQQASGAFVRYLLTSLLTKHSWKQPDVGRRAAARRNPGDWALLARPPTRHRPLRRPTPSSAGGQDDMGSPVERQRRTRARTAAPPPSAGGPIGIELASHRFERRRVSTDPARRRMAAVGCRRRGPQPRRQGSTAGSRTQRAHGG
jgi:hypothetical protein